MAFEIVGVLKRLSGLNSDGLKIDSASDMLPGPSLSLWDLQCVVSEYRG